jgi:hypothetical protein
MLIWWGVAYLCPDSHLFQCFSRVSFATHLCIFQRGQSHSYVMTDGQLVSLSCCQASIWGPRPDFYYCQTVAGLLNVGHPLWREDGSVIYNCCWLSPVQSFSGLSPTGLMTIFCCFRFETPLTWRARPPYLYTPGTRSPSYTPRHWVPFSLPPTTHKATVELLKPAFTGGLQLTDC